MCLRRRAVKSNVGVATRHLDSGKALRLQPRREPVEVGAGGAKLTGVLFRSQPVTIVGGGWIALLFQQLIERGLLAGGALEQQGDPCNGNEGSTAPRSFAAVALGCTWPASTTLRSCASKTVQVKRNKRRNANCRGPMDFLSRGDAPRAAGVALEWTPGPKSSRLPRFPWIPRLLRVPSHGPCPGRRQVAEPDRIRLANPCPVCPGHLADLPPARWPAAAWR